MKKIASAIILLTLSSCNMPNPSYTKFGMNPITKDVYFADTKDNDIELEGFKAGRDAQGGRYGEIAKLKIRNNASDVNRSYVEMMAIWNEQMKTSNEAIKAVVDLLNNTVTTLSPGLNSRLSRAAPSTQGVTR